VSLRGSPVRERAVLPDGRQVDVVVGVPDDGYVAKRELDTVTIELRKGEEVLAVLDTVLDADEDSEARTLARAVASKLASGELEPTAEAIEPLADTLR